MMISRKPNWKLNLKKKKQRRFAPYCIKIIFTYSIWYVWMFWQSNSGNVLLLYTSILNCFLAYNLHFDMQQTIKYYFFNMFLQNLFMIQYLYQKQKAALCTLWCYSEFSAQQRETSWHILWFIFKFKD